MLELLLLTHDVVCLLHHGWLRRIHNVAVDTRDCVLAPTNPNSSAKDIIPRKTG